MSPTNWQACFPKINSDSVQSLLQASGPWPLRDSRQLHVLTAPPGTGPACPEEGATSCHQHRLGGPQDGAGQATSDPSLESSQPWAGALRGPILDTTSVRGWRVQLGPDASDAAPQCHRWSSWPRSQGVPMQGAQMPWCPWRGGGGVGGGTEEGLWARPVPSSPSRAVQVGPGGDVLRTGLRPLPFCPTPGICGSSGGWGAVSRQGPQGATLSGVFT